jgi:hypothetical protein
MVSLVVASAAFFAAVVLFALVMNVINEAEMERAERTDAACAINEGKQADDIRSLKLTYEYVLSLTARQRREPINALIIRELPRVRQDATTDDAAPFCDEPGVGLKEPDPKVPPIPKGLG